MADEKYKYIHFVKTKDKPKTSEWECRNNRSDEVLGWVEWYGPWRQYCFCPDGGMVFNVGCMENIIDFVKKCGEWHREKKQ